MIFSVSLFLACFCLFAQTFREAKIFVPPVNGTGDIGDNVFFFKQLTYEVVIQYHLLVRTQNESDFVLRGSIQRYAGEEQLKGYNYFNDERAQGSFSGPVPIRPIPRIRNTLGRREFFSWETNGNFVFYDTTGEEEYASGPSRLPALLEVRPRAREDFAPEYQDYVFFLELIDSSTGAALAKQHLVYNAVDDDVGKLVSVIVYNMLVGIPDIEEGNDWRNSWLFADITAMWAPMVYQSQQQPVNWVNFGLGLSLECQLLDFLAVGLGLQLVQNLIVVPASDGEEYQDFILQVPVAVKYVFKPLDHFMLEPYFGLSGNFSLMGATQPSFLSWFAGFQFGVKAGPGMIVIEPRFSMDFSKSFILESAIEYQRYLIQLSVGYKFGFLQKYSKAPRDN